MVVAERKPIKEILSMVAPYKKVLVAGCKGCVTVCCAGGAKEVGVLSSALRIARKKEGNPIEVLEATLERQCDPEYVETLRPMLENDGVDAIVSIACSVGPQFISNQFDVQIYPGLNTTFIGGAKEHGVWAEFCQACGNCIIGEFGGICPITRCSKSLMNGPCGGSADKKCEISPEVDCAWHLIYDKMVQLGRLEELRKIHPVKDWSTSRDGGPRKLVREDMKL